MTKQNICIIGAGPTGCAVFHALKKHNLLDSFDVTIYEKQKTIGGLWNFNFHTGTDNNGEPVHSSMYRDLVINSPGENLEFADYSYMKHFGKKITSFPVREVMLNYFNGRYDYKELPEACRFNHAVNWVEFDENMDKFKVRVTNCATQIDENLVFDYVFVCSGHYHKPNIVDFPGFENFTGRIMHSHEFRDGREFKNQTVLTIGGSKSSEDIASLCVKFGATKSIVCNRENRNSLFFRYKWPESNDEFRVEKREFKLKVDINGKQEPLIKVGKDNTVIFPDGTETKVDAIIVCTGYKHYYPFLEQSLRYTGPDCLYPKNFYKGMFWINNPKLAYMGVAKNIFTFPLFDSQASYAAQVLAGKIEMPEKSERIEENLSKREQMLKITDAMKTFKFQSDYVKELNEITGDFPGIDPDKMNDNYVQFNLNKFNDVWGFRNKSHFSLIDGEESPVLTKRWAERLDDGMEAYFEDLP